MAETVAAERWLYTVLSGDATLAGLVSGVFAYMAPSTASLPYVVYTMQSGRDLNGLGPTRWWSDTRYLVRGIAETTTFGGDLKTIADRIDAVLQAASGTVVDGTVVVCVREQPFSMVEVANERQYRHLGGVYRLIVQ